MADIRFHCPECRQKIAVDESAGGMQVDCPNCRSTLIIPMVAACCLTAIANISNAQLASINRLGATVVFASAAGLLAIAGVWLGWRTAGLAGAAYGFLFSRLALVAQDLFTIRLIGAGGWLNAGTWRTFAGQGLLAGVFALTYLGLPRLSNWVLIPAALHAGLAAAWLLRQPLLKYFAGPGRLLST